MTNQEQQCQCPARVLLRDLIPCPYCGAEDRHDHATHCSVSATLDAKCPCGEWEVSAEYHQKAANEYRQKNAQLREQLAAEDEQLAAIAHERDVAEEESAHWQRELAAVTREVEDACAAARFQNDRAEKAEAREADAMKALEQERGRLDALVKNRWWVRPAADERTPWRWVVISVESGSFVATGWTRNEAIDAAIVAQEAPKS